MKIAPQFVRQAMVKEIAEWGQEALEGSTMTVDLALPSGQCAMLYARASGISVVAGRTSEGAIECGYSFAHAGPQQVALGALAVIDHIRSTLLLQVR